MPAAEQPPPAFDLLDPAIQAEPFAQYAWLRERAPVYPARWRKGATVYVLSRHDDVVRALKDAATRSTCTA